MSILNLFTVKKENDILNISKFLLRGLNVKFTSKNLSDKLVNHAEYPSLLSLKDILFDYSIESAAIRKGEYSYSDFETPFICSIQKEGWSKPSFTIVTKAEDNGIEYLEPLSNSIQSISLQDFEKIDKNIILLMDTSAAKDEPNLETNRTKERARKVSKRVPVYLTILALITSVGFSLSSPFGIENGIGIGYILTSFIGLLASSLLLWHDIDAHNPFLKEVCGGNAKKMNCNAVLTSSKASFLGLSWSTWGFAYFACFFVTQILFPANISFIALWSTLSIIAAPYILFSIYYQGKIVKQWCPLCIAVQAVLAVNALIAVVFMVSGTYALTAITPYSTIIVLLLGSSLLFAAYKAIPIFKSANDSKSYEKKWKNLRYNPEIFNALLDKAETVNYSVENLGIVVGNPNATNEIIKVCNPYCGPCAKAHPELEHIVNSNNDVKVRIIFTASGEEEDIKTPPVAHLLAIQQKLGVETVHTALDDWYMAPSKDYEAFAKKYPMNGELKQQTEKIQAMRDWCNDMKIRATPTIYINGRELPDNYNIADLKNFF
ncbi:vitamin K epoxide reductase family protein [Sphingobacterium sp. xlx-130]|uniref:vitamin K epoxide reductase family protein n=1 Tax=Sphingobacterium sp. xlx-130 TaxID=2654323 RepID=UPI0013DBBE89|nr:vitamin K epoxide reductase family protein [Sphingobacterium sp. xlx-130]